jgi:prepilin-type N-terminal cleavage/methylation domain-containing protein
MKNRKKNKGFTLVELIVVLVILAILAAILVPALLGYIDRAKEQQVLLNARSCMMAAQAELSELYAKEEVWSKYMDVSGTDIANTIIDTADVSCDWLVVGCDAAMAKGVRAGYKVTFVYYKEGDYEVYFDGTTWVEGSWPEELSRTKYIYYIKRGGDDSYYENN